MSERTTPRKTKRRGITPATDCCPCQARGVTRGALIERERICAWLDAEVARSGCYPSKGALYSMVDSIRRGSHEFS